MKERLYRKVYNAPCGRLVLGSVGEMLCLCDWLDGTHGVSLSATLERHLGIDSVVGSTEVLMRAEQWLDAYFSGVVDAPDLPLMLVGTEFQKRVWNELTGIPSGATITYKELASRVGRPAAVRAVANAVGANRLSVFIPCHRVIGSDNSMTGYAGGIAAKRFLLSLEAGVARSNEHGTFF